MRVWGQEDESPTEESSGRAAEAERFLQFKQNFVYVIQLFKFSSRSVMGKISNPALNSTSLQKGLYFRHMLHVGKNYWLAGRGGTWLNVHPQIRHCIQCRLVCKTYHLLNH